MAIRSQYLVAILDYDYNGKNFYLITEPYQHLAPLETVLLEYPKLALEEKRGLSLQVLQALIDYHSAKKIYGTLNLSAIRVDSRQGTIKLIPGVFQAQLLQRHLPSLEVVEESVFLAPEFIHYQKLGPAADQYGLGVLLYFLYTAHWPYTYTSTIQELKSEWRHFPPLPESLNPEMPKMVSQVIVRCLALAPQQRFANLNELKSVWEGYMEMPPAKPGEDRAILADIEKEEVKIQTMRKRKTKKWIRYILIGGALIAVVSMGLHWLLDTVPEVQVPNVTRQPLEAGQKTLRQAKLVPQILAYRPDPDLPSGYIIDTTPPPGRRVRQYRVIKLMISKGQEGLHVMDFRGKTVEDAKNITGESAVISIMDSQFSEEFPAGTIIAQNPAPDAEIQQKGTIGVVVSKGFPLSVTVQEVPGGPADKRRVIIETQVARSWPTQQMVVAYTVNEEKTELLKETLLPAVHKLADVAVTPGGVLEISMNGFPVLQQEIPSDTPQ